MTRNFPTVVDLQLGVFGRNLKTPVPPRLSGAVTRGSLGTASFATCGGIQFHHLNCIDNLVLCS